MGDVQPDSIKLVNKFPSFSSISVVDNLFATLWAAIVQDIESVVSDFLLLEAWDFSTFIRAAEARNIVAIHRCAFSLFALDKNLVWLKDRTRRGRNREQLQTYRRIVGTIFTVAKDVWLEPSVLEGGRSELISLKRSVTGLYLLYYLWHNQIPRDEHKVLIKYSIEDEQRARIVGEKFLRLESRIPDSAVVKKCYQFTVTALSKRNALSYTYIVDEPKLEYQHWQHMYLKNCAVRKALTAINANAYCASAVPDLVKICRRMIEIMEQVKEIATTPVGRSLFFRKVLPENVIKNMLQMNSSYDPVSMKIQFDYSDLLHDISTGVVLNVELLNRPFLCLDCLLQTDKSSQKIRNVGLKLTKISKQRFLYNKKVYEKKKANFNRFCDSYSIPARKIPKTRKYRSMESPAWLFIGGNFDSIFTESGTKISAASDQANIPSCSTAIPNRVEDLHSQDSRKDVPSYCRVQPFPQRQPITRRISATTNTLSQQSGNELDKDEKLLQAGVKRQVVPVVDESAETLKEICGIRTRSSRRCVGKK